MAPLPGPFEILEMSDGEVRELHILSWQSGEMLISPRDGRGPKTITAVRVFVPPTDKLAFPFYWDLTATTLVAQVLPILQSRPAGGVELRLSKYGVAPKARYSVAVVSLSGPSA